MAKRSKSHKSISKKTKHSARSKPSKKVKPLVKHKAKPKPQPKAHPKPKIAKPKQSEEIKHLPPPKTYVTRLDSLFALIEEEGSISQKELAEKLNIPIEKVEEWVKVLNTQGLIELHYPIAGSIQARKKGYVKPKDKKEKKEHKQHKPKKKINIIIIIIIAVLAIFLLLFFILVKGGYLVIE